jgi:hypothetical protein
MTVLEVLPSRIVSKTSKRFTGIKSLLSLYFTFVTVYHLCSPSAPVNQLLWSVKIMFCACQSVSKVLLAYDCVGRVSNLMKNLFVIFSLFVTSEVGIPRHFWKRGSEKTKWMKGTTCKPADALCYILEKEDIRLFEKQMILFKLSLKILFLNYPVSRFQVTHSRAEQPCQNLHSACAFFTVCNLRVSATQSGGSMCQPVCECQGKFATGSMDSLCQCNCVTVPVCEFVHVSLCTWVTSSQWLALCMDVSSCVATGSVCTYYKWYMCVSVSCKCVCLCVCLCLCTCVSHTASVCVTVSLCMCVHAACVPVWLC